jgi:hypothetical protein
LLALLGGATIVVVSRLRVKYDVLDVNGFNIILVLFYVYATCKVRDTVNNITRSFLIDIIIRNQDTKSLNNLISNIYYKTSSCVIDGVTYLTLVYYTTGMANLKYATCFGLYLRHLQTCQYKILTRKTIKI